MFSCGAPGDGRVECWALALLIACLSGGCVTKQENSNSTEAKSPQPGSGIKEYQELAKEALKGLRGTLDSLDKITSQGNPCPPKLIAAFSDKVQRLQVDSLRIRARAHAIQARGDAYFTDWSQSIGRIQDAKVRANAERFHPQLEQSFNKIKLASQQAGGEFKPFLHGLRMLRLDVDKHSGLSLEDATKDLVRVTREHGNGVIDQLKVIDSELDNITSMLRAGKPASTNPS